MSKENRLINFLGILVDENLSWNAHIDYIASKISKNLGILYKTRHVLDRKSLTQLYFSFINSYLNYGNIAWGSTHKTKLVRLHRIQKHAARIIHFKSKFYHSQPLLLEMKALNVYQLNLYKHSCFMFLFREGKTPTTFDTYFTVTDNKYSTRSCGSFHKPFYKTNCSRFSVSYRGPSIWNILSFSNTRLIKADSYKHFKALVKNVLLTSSHDQILQHF